MNPSRCRSVTCSTSGRRLDGTLYLPNRSPVPPRQRKPGEALFECLRGDGRFFCELRDHGETYGVEAQFYQNDEFLHSRRFATRALASQWAEEERKVIGKGGA
jgi:hypothetical protein